MATDSLDTHQQLPLSAVEAGVTSEGLKLRLHAAREAQLRWERVSVKDRLRMLRSIRHKIAERADLLVQSVTYPQRSRRSETLAGELIPLADACRFLEREAKRILAPRRLRRRGRPLWLSGVSVELRREPYGIVLIIGAANYPLFLPGVQTLQALAAGNAVLIKPGGGATATTQAFVDVLVAAGLDGNLVQLLPETPACLEAVISAGVHKVVLTGSVAAGRSVQSLLAKSLIPSTMELSGCDAVFVLDGADLDRLARCLVFSLRFNGGCTCLAPKRVFVPRKLQSTLERQLREKLSCRNEDQPVLYSEHARQLVADAVRQGARIVSGGDAGDQGAIALTGPTVLSDADPEMTLLRSDLFAPVLSFVPVDSIEQALAADRLCPYALGAAVFGGEKSARQIAAQVEAGCVVINDIIAPTADPRVPFGGRGDSGFGVTRGAAGLEEMTQWKAIVEQHGRWLPHLDEPTPLDAALLSGYLGMTHGRGWKYRLGSASSAVRAALQQRRWKRHQLNHGRQNAE